MNDLQAGSGFKPGVAINGTFDLRSGALLYYSSSAHVLASISSLLNTSNFLVQKGENETSLYLTEVLVSATCAAGFISRHGD